MTMKKLLLTLLLVTATLPLSGCSALSRLWGGTDDTVLPGQREDAIPGHASFPEAGDTGGVDTASSTATQDQAAGPAPPAQAPAVDCTDPKNKKDPSCADQSSGDGTFSDGQ